MVKFLITSLLLISIAAEALINAASGGALTPKERLAMGSWETIRASNSQNTPDISNYRCGEEAISYVLNAAKDRLELVVAGKIIGGTTVLGDGVDSEDRPFVLILYDNEKRLGPDGNPIIWSATFLSNDRFVWRALNSTGEHYLGSSKERARCQAIGV